MQFEKYNNVYFNLLRDERNKWKSNRYKPIFKLTESLPEENLIDLTVFLINLTYFKRRYSTDRENVGPNVNVALLKPDSIRFIKAKNRNR